MNSEQNYTVLTHVHVWITYTLKPQCFNKYFIPDICILFFNFILNTLQIAISLKNGDRLHKQG